MYHTIAFHQSITSITPVIIGGVTDPVIQVVEQRFRLQDDWMLYAAYCQGVDLSRARIVLPQFNTIASPELSPVNVGAAPANISPLVDWHMMPVRLRGRQQLEVQAANAAAGANTVQVVLFLSDKMMQMPGSDAMITLRGTGTTVVAAAAWSTCNITWDQVLEAGYYLCVGARFISVTGVAGRLNFQGQQNRPGGIAVASAALRGPERFRRGGMGVWGRFEALSMPQVEFFCTAADTAQTVHLDLQRVG